MATFFEENRARLENFSRVSKTVGGRADYVQGGGGNTSVKLEGGNMAIKASGFCLKDIEVDKAYAVLDYEALRTFYYGSNPADFEDVEKTGSAKAKEVTKTIEGLAALRPSVEAGFHSILDTYVAHSHSVYANLAACSVECGEIVKKALADADYRWGMVPYTDPGARLTFSIRDELTHVEKETGKRPAAIEGGLVEADAPFLSEMLKSGAFDERFFLETPLYPDQMVFLIGSFAFGKGTPEQDQCLADPETGRVVFNMAASKAQVIAETLTAVVFIADAIRKNGKTLSTMGEAAKKFIANWESEKYRKSLAGKK